LGPHVALLVVQGAFAAQPARSAARVGQRGYISPYSSNPLFLPQGAEPGGTQAVSEVKATSSHSSGGLLPLNWCLTTPKTPTTLTCPSHLRGSRCNPPNWYWVWKQERGLWVSVISEVTWANKTGSQSVYALMVVHPGR